VGSGQKFRRINKYLQLS